MMERADGCRCALADILRFPALGAVPGLRHGLILRTPGVDTSCDRQQALARLEDSHAAALAAAGIPKGRLALCEQVHGAEVATISAVPVAPLPGVDALATDRPGIALGIYVADCCPVYLVDPVRRVIALAHSGRKGTELGIARASIRLMRERFDSQPAAIISVLGPCIRPPHYEVDIALDIASQCAQEGVKQVQDCGLCTGSDLQRFYSYRIERGQTGRMLAFLMLDDYTDAVANL